MKLRCLLAVLLALHGAASAQTVYESKDKDGPVFSDRPSPGAMPVDATPRNVVSPPAAQPAPPSPPPAAAPAYRRLVIVRPAAQDMVHSNTGAFGISASLSPALRPNDRIRVLIDGNLVPTVFRSTDVRISEQDWRAAAVGDDGEHTLQLAVVDADGKPRIESEPLRFYLRRAAVGGARR